MDFHKNMYDSYENLDTHQVNYLISRSLPAIGHT